MEVWIGPAIVAALVSAFVSAAGWFVSSWQAQRLDERRRDEKVHDFQVALRAEVASDLDNLRTSNRRDIKGEVDAAFRADPAYQPFIPHLAKNVVFEQIVREIHILPDEVIASIIRYSSLRQSIDNFVFDLRRAIEDKLPAARLQLMMRDYLEMLDRLEALAARACGDLDSSLRVNRPGADPSPGQASAPASLRSALP